MKNISNKITWKKIAIVLFIILAIYLIIYFVLKGNKKVVQTTITLGQYDIVINDNTIIYAKTDNNQETIIINKNDGYEVKLVGEINRDYEFTIEDEVGKTYTFIYSFDDKENLTLREK